MKKILTILILFVALAFSANAQNSMFAGKYELSEDGGKTAGGTAVFIGHDLTVNADGTGRLTAAGYQTSKEMFVKTKVVGPKLQVIFDKYDEDGTNSFTPYKGSELLFTLEWKTVKGKKVLWTIFKEYQPSLGDAKKAGGIYFKKSKR